jgi:hypothetical protein
MTRVAEARQATMRRDEAPGDVQMARAFFAVAAGLVLAAAQLCLLNEMTGRMMTFVLGAH